MRKITIIIATLIAFSSTGVMCQTTDKPAKKKNVVTKEYRENAIKLFKVFEYQTDYKQMFSNVTARIMRYNQDIPKEFFTKMEKEFNQEKYFDELLEVYAQVFDEKDIKFLSDFYCSATFKRFQMLSEGVVTKMSEVSDKYYNRMLDTIREKMEDAKYPIPDFLQPIDNKE